MGTLSMSFNSVVIPALVLFDSEASHSFIAMRYTWRHGLKVSATTSPYVIDAPGAKILVSQCLPRASVIINEMHFGANLLVMDSKGIHVILGMNWLTKNEAIMDCAQWIVTLSGPSGTRIQLKLEGVKSCLFALKAIPTIDMMSIPVV